MDELEIICHRQIEGFSIFFDTVEYRTPHFHPEWELIWVLENALSVSCGGEQFAAYPGHLMLFQPNEPHEFHKIQDGCTCLYLQISPTVLPKVMPVSVDERRLDLCLSKSQIDDIKRKLAGLIRAYLEKQDYFELYCIGTGCLLLQQLLVSLPTHLRTTEEMEGISKRNALLKRLINFVDTNYMHKIRLTDFAETEGYSVGYLSRFVKNTLNQNFQGYVSSVRFHCACKLIREGKKRMLDVCTESGFSDYRYFSREFQRQYAMTPEQYSTYVEKLHLESASVRHSLHSVERFYTREESIDLVKQYLNEDISR